MFGNIVIEVASLTGFAALVSVIVSALKQFGVVKDGTSDKWVAGLNLAGVLGLYIARMFIPEFNVIPVDSAMGEIALVAGYVLSYVAMILSSKATYFAFKGLPVIGKSFSK